MEENNNQKKRSFGDLVQTLALTAMLVFLPLGSWYYLQIGFNYNKDMMAQLKDYGQIPAFDLYTQQGTNLSKQDLAGKLVVAAFFSNESPYLDSLFSGINKIHEQFNEREDVYFLLHHLDSLSPAQLQEIAQRYELKDREQCFLLSGNPEQMQALLKGYGIPQLPLATDTSTYQVKHNVANSIEDYPFLVLADTSSVIRNFYEVDKGKALFRLVEHLAIKLPREVEEKPVLKRDKEK